MSQYRSEDTGAHPDSEAKSSRETHQNTTQLDISVKTETQDTSAHVAHSFTNTIRSEYSEDYVSKISPTDYTRQSRFLPSQNITQPIGPTPTLNQLLQATSSPVHRFHSNYSSIGSESYQQSWQAQRTPAVSPIYSQSNQRPSQVLTQYGISSGQTSNLYQEQRSWNQSSNNPIPALTNQVSTSNQSPQRALSQSPAPPTAISPQPQSSTPSQSFHGLQRSTTPSTQGLDSGELSGQNSNDSSNGPAGPTTPTSQGMRPTPSPTGSTGSRSMSPAVGQQTIQIPPRPSSSQSDNSNPTRLSLSPLANQGCETTSGSFAQAHPYKISSSGQSSIQGNPIQNSTNSVSAGPVHTNAFNPATGCGSQGNYPSVRPHLQFPSMVNNQYQSGRSNNPSQYTTYSVYNTGGNMGPPAMGPPAASQIHINQLVHTNSSSESTPMPPPNTSSSSPNSCSHTITESGSNLEPQTDMNITNSTLSTGPVTANSTVTSVITTGPDGTTLDEASQQSTLSNASAASAEDSGFTSKVRKDIMSYHNHPATPSSTIPSPGTGSINSIHEDYSDMNSPGWPRTPASPVYNSQISHDPYRSKKSDSLSKLYEMEDSIERRSWLDKLVNFMEERRTPITSCPTISKNPLDLFRLYLYVKERGGFMEVCKVTKNKTWKDIAGLLGIGASSSAAYTLRKHYTKHLLAYECHFDRGGVDPQPIINQVEAGSKKKGSKGTSSVPSPGSSNSQDSFPSGNTNNVTVESYGNYQNSYSTNTTGGSSIEYSSTPIRAPTQNNATTPHQVGIQQANYQSSGPFQNYSQDQYIRQSSTLTQTNEFQAYNSRVHFPPYTADNERNYSGNNLASTNSNNQELYGRYSGNPQTSSYSNVTSSGLRTYSAASQGHSINSHQSTPTQQPSPSQSISGTAYSCSQDYYRQDQSSYGSAIGSQLYSGTASKNMPPPPPSSQQPRRHPDFAKDQQYTSYNQQRPTYAGWPSGNNQYNTSTNIRLQYSNQQSPQQQHQQNQGIINSSATSTLTITNCQQWNNQPPRPASQGNITSNTNTVPTWDHRCNSTPSSAYPSVGSHQSQHSMSSINQQSITKREMTFPVDSVEAVSPLLYKRRKIFRTDVAPVEAWRIMMALRSGLLAESCWALDVLNILLFDDTSIHYFGLTNLPGLLDILLEHFSRSLSDMFDFTLLEKNHLCNRQTHNLKIDLGAVNNSISPEECVKLLSCSNYTFSTRKGKPVKLVPRDDDIFILDEQRSWDIEYTESDVEPWQIESRIVNYIVTCFETEVNKISFMNYSNHAISIGSKAHLSKEHNDGFEKDVTSVIDRNKQIKPVDDILEDAITFHYISIDDKNKNIEPRQDKKKKIRTLTDVLLRIKKLPLEMSNITKEMFEKKNDNTRKDNRVEAHDSSSIDQSNKSILAYNSDFFCSTNQNSITSEKFFDCTESERKNSSSSTAQFENQNVNPKNFENDFIAKIQKDPILTEAEIKLKVKDPSGTLKRRKISDCEDESYSRDEASLYLITETQDNLARRCVCLSTILRNLTFIPGNEIEFAKNITFLSLLGKLFLLYHDHPMRTQKTRNYDREEDADFVDSCSSLQGESEWWWDFLYHIRENILVMAANISGHIDLSQYPEEISRPILDGLLHWAVCPAAHGQDPFPTVNLNSSLSPQRLALEALCKLCVTESNVDLVVATPPFSRLQKLCSVLSRLLCRSEEQVLREFGVNLLHFLSAADSGVARTIALQTPCIALLVAFIEQAENNALGVANQHGIAALRDNPESMGTSLDMLRRAAGTLLNLSRHPDNKALLLQHESRLLALVMSQILDQQVAAIVARVLFQCSRGAT